jgi:hypothetical protein
MTMTRHNDQDHEVWMRCFTAAIAGVFPAREAQTRPDPAVLVEWCGKIADAALEVERQRRRNPDFQAVVAGPRP